MKGSNEPKYSLNDFNRFNNDTLTSKYHLSETILFLLYARKVPIKGKIRQMKEVFLMLNEIFSNDVQYIPFDKHKFGPYSEEVEYTIDQLISTNHITSSGDKRGNDYSITLTEKGKTYIANKFYKLPKNIQDKLKEKREQWDTHIPKGILNVVYTHYEEYLENAILKKRYRPLDWEDENQRPE